MPQSIAALALLVPDYDQAIDYYVGVLGFDLVEDTKLSETKRFVRVRPPNEAGGASILLAKAKNAAEQAAIGDQSGGRVFLFLHTDDFVRDYARYLEKGVDFIEEPRHEPYGTVVVFRDLFGNLWDLVQPK